MLKITRLKLLAQILFFLVFAYLGYLLGVKILAWKKLELVLPTFSCYFADHRIANCFLFSLQQGITAGWRAAYTNLLVPVLIFLVLGLIAGRAWCSWVCPIGFVQDLFTSVRKFLNFRYFNLSATLKLASKAGKWFFVIYLVIVAAGIGIPNFFPKKYKFDLVTPYCQLCPGKQIFPLSEGRFKDMLTVDKTSALSTTMSWLAIGSFAFYLLTTSFIRRMWCRLCPMGALLGLLNKVSFLSLRKEGKRCTKCGICLRVCPVQVKEVYEEKVKQRVTPDECILCLRCVEMCPEKDALKASFFKLPIVSSSYKRFIRSTAVKVNKKQI